MAPAHCVMLIPKYLFIQYLAVTNLYWLGMAPVMMKPIILIVVLMEETAVMTKKDLIGMSIVINAHVCNQRKVGLT